MQRYWKEGKNGREEDGGRGWRGFKWAKGKMRQAWVELRVGGCDTKDSCSSVPLCEGWGGVDEWRGEGNNSDAKESFTGLGSLEFKEQQPNKELNLKYNQRLLQSQNPALGI